SGTTNPYGIRAWKICKTCRARLGRARPLDALDLARSRLHRQRDHLQFCNKAVALAADEETATLQGAASSLTKWHEGPCHMATAKLSAQRLKRKVRDWHRGRWPRPVWSRVCGRG